MLRPPHVAGLALILASSAGSAAPLGVLGDSDSAGYQDRINLPESAERRGGAWRETSLQWTEVIARLRPQHLDLGPREATGMPGWQARLWGLWRDAPRAPRKFDHRHNFAVSGAVCANLVEGPAPQAAALRGLIRREPERWARGTVVIRIGINDLGIREVLERVARGEDEDAKRRRASCLASIEQAVRALRSAQPGLRIVLVGLFDNAHWSRWTGDWEQPEALARLDAHAEAFDAGLRAIGREHDTLFFSDRNWFRSRWGGRDVQGRAAYLTVTLGPWQVTNTQGDAPQNASLGDGHAGTIWNALWADALIATLNDAGGREEIPRLRQEEILQLLPPAPALPSTPSP